MLSAEAALPAIAALFAAGAAAGILAGLLGVGGGLILVPALYHLGGPLGIEAELRMHIAVGTSLATIVATSASSALAHRRRGAIDGDALKALAPAAAVGAGLGALLAGMIDGPRLTLVFSLFALLAALRMAFAGRPAALTDHLPGRPVLLASGGLIGLLSALLGIGGGIVSVPILTMFGRPIHRAVGTSAAIGGAIAVPGALGFVLTGWDVAALPPASLGYVNVAAAAVIIAATIICAPLGARLAHATNPTRLKRVFAALLALAALRMLINV